MKTLFSLFVTLAMTASAPAQGKVRLVNDSLHLVYWSPYTYDLHPGDAALAGQPYNIGDARVTFALRLWAGTSSSSLSLVATTDFNGQGAPGTWPGENVILPNGLPGVPAFFQIEIFDAAYPGPLPGPNTYHGHSPVFIATPGFSTYNSLVRHTSPAFSMWDDGIYNMDFVSPGYRGALALWTMPEPSAFALSGLAFALLLLRAGSKGKK